MINEYINFVEEWCEVLESKAFASQHGQWSKEKPTTFFHFKINKKYTKIIRTTHGSDSVHAFVDNSNLDILKAAAWNLPAKGARYNLVENFDRVLEVCDPHGGNLYQKTKAKV